MFPNVGRKCPNIIPQLKKTISMAISLNIYNQLYFTIFSLALVSISDKVEDIFHTLLSLSLYVYIYIYIQRSSNKFPDFFRMGTFIHSTHMKL